MLDHTYLKIYCLHRYSFPTSVPDFPVIIVISLRCRYYNSWIETSDEPAQSDSSSSRSQTPRNSVSEKRVSLPTNFATKNSLDLTDNIEKFAPPVDGASMDFSISYELSRSHGYGGDTESDSSEDESPEEDVFALCFM